MDPKEALNRAVSIAGGQSELERRIKALGRTVSQPAIALWVKAGRVPEGKDWAIWIARAVNFQVMPHDLDRSAYPNVWDGMPLERARSLIEERVAA
jgi:DNA-binding transcriptional regulator YdaS (Cro superfamily)